MVQIKAKSSKTKKSKPDPLEMEPVLHSNKDDGEYGETTGRSAPSQPKPLDPIIVAHNFISFLVAYATYYKNITAPIAAIVVIIIITLMLEHIAKVGSGHHKVSIDHDYARANSMDLKVGQISHWCLQGGNSNCKCDDPTDPVFPTGKSGWTKSFVSHMKEVGEIIKTTDIDVVFAGDDTVEEWTGYQFSEKLHRLQSLSKYWNGQFNRTVDANNLCDGLALGMAGDTISNLYWRMLKGTAYQALTPKVWWLVIGTNDLKFGQCSEEVVVLGILRLMEYIHHRKPEVLIVINSLLPQEYNIRAQRGGKFALWPSIRSINLELEKFCKNHRYFHYFDATSILARNPAGEKLSLHSDLYADDRQGLSLRGHQKLIKGIKGFIDELLFEDTDDASLNEMDDDTKQ